MAVVVLRHGWPDWWNLPLLFIGVPFGFFVVGMMLLIPIGLVSYAFKKILYPRKDQP
jgi:hypothetical protein